MSHKIFDTASPNQVRAAFDSAGQSHGFEDLFRSKAGRRSLFMVVLKAGDAVCRSRCPRQIKRGVFSSMRPFLLRISFFYKTKKPPIRLHNYFL
jgi:hypothetical protein